MGAKVGAISRRHQATPSNGEDFLRIEVIFLRMAISLATVTSFTQRSIPRIGLIPMGRSLVVGSVDIWA